MSARIITGTIKVQVSKYTGPRDLAEADDRKALSLLHFVNHDMSEHGYSVVGEAVMTVTLNDPDKIVCDKIESMRAEQKKLRADAHAADVRLEGQIQQLLAITHEAGEA